MGALEACSSVGVAGAAYIYALFLLSLLQMLIGDEADNFFDVSIGAPFKGGVFAVGTGARGGDSVKVYAAYDESRQSYSQLGGTLRGHALSLLANATRLAVGTPYDDKNSDIVTTSFALMS